MIEEVCEAFLETEPKKQCEEMIQVAAVFVQIIEYLDRMAIDKKELEENPRWANLYKRAAQKYLENGITKREGNKTDIETYYNWWAR